MTKEINYKLIIQEGIPLIQQWLSKQDENIKQTEDYKEVERVINDIIHEEDWSKDAYLDIQFILKPFEESLPLKIKRLFNVCTLDLYTIFLTSMWFELLMITLI